jgi:hypothetical protein
MQETCSGARSCSISLNWLTQYNTYIEIGALLHLLVQTIYFYKSIADGENLGTLIAARYKPVCSCDRKLADRYT